MPRPARPWCPSPRRSVKLTPVLGRGGRQLPHTTFSYKKALPYGIAPKDELPDDSRDLDEAIREILFSEWDPIGVNDVAPDNEYDSYVPTIYPLREPGKDERRIVEPLRRSPSRTPRARALWACGIGP